MSSKSLKGPIYSFINFHSKPLKQTRGQRCFATRRPAPSPTIRTSRKKSKFIDPNLQHASQKLLSVDSIWPSVDKAHALGFIELPAIKAAELLEQFSKLRGSPTAQARLLSEEWKLDPKSALCLAIMFSDIQHSSYLSLAQDFLIATLKQNDAEIAKLVVQQAVERGDLERPATAIALSQLEKLASDNDIEALVILGQVRELKPKMQGNGALDAQSLYERVWTSSKTAPWNDDRSPKVGLCEALISLARLAYASQEFADVKKYLKAAALDFDDREALFLLSNHVTSINSQVWDNYMLKAAASGHLHAAHCLGVHYLAQSLNILPRNSVSIMLSGKADSVKAISHLQTLAIEWFTIAASAPPKKPNLPSSHVLLAILLRSQGKHDEGLQWLLTKPVSKEPEHQPAFRKKRISTPNIDSWSWLDVNAWCEKHWTESEMDLMEANWISAPDKYPSLCIRALLRAWVDERRNNTEGLLKSPCLAWGECDVYPEVRSTGKR